MATKETKLNQIKQAVNTQGKSVFQPGMFSGMGNVPMLQPKSDDYSYVNIELEDIIMDEDVSVPSFLYDSIKNGRIVNPIIVAHKYEISERAGKKFKKKTGQYTIIDGKKRYAVYKRLFNENTNENNVAGAGQYASIPTLLLPLNISDEEIESIKKVTEENKSESTTAVIKDITETRNEQITYCYKYEMAEIELDKIVERENKYTILQTEVDELEKSIYHAGLMQPIILLPFINPKTMEVAYEIEAGHKRTRSIRQLVKHAEEGVYDNGELIIRTFKTVPALLMPMGATKEQVEKVYNDTNLLTRHMSTDDVFEHISYFEELPSRPETKADYLDFRSKRYQMSKLANILQNKFKKLGFSDWQNRRSKIFLNVYYYGSDKCLDTFKNISDNKFTQRELEWIAVNYRDFNERKMQDEIIEKAMVNKSFLLRLMDEKKVKRTPQKINVRKASETLIKQKAVLEKISITPFDYKKVTEEDLENTKNILKEMEEIMKELKDRLDNIPESKLEKSE